MRINGYPLDEIRLLTREHPEAEQRFMAFVRMCSHPDACFGDDRDLVETRELLRTKPKKIGLTGKFSVHVALENLAPIKPMGW